MGLSPGFEAALSHGGVFDGLGLQGVKAVVPRNNGTFVQDSLNL